MRDISVLMLANSANDNEVRIVDVPDERMNGASLLQQLDTVFTFGQNEFQPKPHCSVSCGDVIQLNGDNYLVCRVGFRKLTPSELSYYMTIPRMDRHFCDLVSEATT